MRLSKSEHGRRCSGGALGVAVTHLVLPRVDRDLLDMFSKAVGCNFSSWSSSHHLKATRAEASYFSNHLIVRDLMRYGGAPGPEGMC